MIIKSILKEILEDQWQYFQTNEVTITREIQSEVVLNLPQAVILTGIRRAGKSTLLKQILLNQAAQKPSAKPIGYVHFDDPRLTSFTVEDFYSIEALWPEIKQFQFDEIQTVPRWEEYIRQGLERKLQYALTGSNAKLLSMELGTLLTGRHVSHEVFPFSLQEFAAYRQKQMSATVFDAYFETGGFPEYIAHTIPRYHQELFKDIIQRDIAVRNAIRNTYQLSVLALHLLNNIGRPFTYNKLAKNYQIKSVKTVSGFVGLYEDAYLLFTVNKFDFSFKKQQVNEKKIYAVDHKLAQQNATQMHQDKGRTLENMVFIAIRRRTKQIWYYKNSSECDFIYQWNNQYHAVQVCWELNAENQERELNGLLMAVKELSITHAVIITAYQRDEFTIDNCQIQCIPFWEWNL